jgi:hypothetical protein
VTLLDDNREMSTIPLKVFHCYLVSEGAAEFYVAAEDAAEARRHAEELTHDIDDWGHEESVEWIHETPIDKVDTRHMGPVWIGGDGAKGRWVDDVTELPRRPRVFEGQEQLDL